ncbi:MAG: DoxX family protein [Desulfuromonas sp.]|nr:MAG: DoxX family protein [Desulfuromonas sp.]
MSRAQRWVYHACRLLLGGAFLYAGVVKAQDVQTFAGGVAAYQLLPFNLNYLVAAALPWMEILAGGLLVVNRHVRAAALVATALTGLFIAVLASVIARGLEIDCGCFAAADPTSPWQALVRDFLLLVAAHMVFHLRGIDPQRETS